MYLVFPHAHCARYCSPAGLAVEIRLQPQPKLAGIAEVPREPYRRLRGQRPLSGQDVADKAPRNAGVARELALAEFPRMQELLAQYFSGMDVAQPSHPFLISRLGTRAA